MNQIVLIFVLAWIVHLNVLDLVMPCLKWLVLLLVLLGECFQTLSNTLQTGVVFHWWRQLLSAWFYQRFLVIRGKYARIRSPPVFSF